MSDSESEKRALKNILLMMGFPEDEKLEFAVRNSDSSEEAMEYLVGGMRNVFTESIISQTKQQEYKMVILMRRDLKLSKGKVGSQCVHAALDVVRRIESGRNRAWKDCMLNWQISGEKTVVVSVRDFEDLKKLHILASKSNLPYGKIIRDAGRTEVVSSTDTCFALGPGDSNEVDKISGRLKLM